MWTFTRFGFFSATCARQGEGSYGSPVDPDRIMVRAREVEHLEGLKAFAASQIDHYREHPDLLAALEEVASAPIHQSRNSDYIARIFATKPAWAYVLMLVALDTDYDNFKSAVLAAQGRTKYEEALHSVWSTMYRTQEARHGHGIYSRPFPRRSHAHAPAR